MQRSNAIKLTIGGLVVVSLCVLFIALDPMELFSSSPPAPASVTSTPAAPSTQPPQAPPVAPQTQPKLVRTGCLWNVEVENGKATCTTRQLCEDDMDAIKTGKLPISRAKDGIPDYKFYFNDFKKSLAKFRKETASDQGTIAIKLLQGVIDRIAKKQCVLNFYDGTNVTLSEIKKSGEYFELSPENERDLIPVSKDEIDKVTEFFEDVAIPALGAKIN